MKFHSLKIPALSSRLHFPLPCCYVCFCTPACQSVDEMVCVCKFFFSCICHTWCCCRFHIPRSRKTGPASSRSAVVRWSSWLLSESVHPSPSWQQPLCEDGGWCLWISRVTTAPVSSSREKKLLLIVLSWFLLHLYLSTPQEKCTVESLQTKSTTVPWTVNASIFPAAKNGLCL